MPKRIAHPLYVEEKPAEEPYASKLDRIAELRTQIEDLEEDISGLEMWMLGTLLQEASQPESIAFRVEQCFPDPGLREGVRLALGGWYCPKNGARRCVYNTLSDPYHDYCLFCGEPEERTIREGV